jgi:hypothetical protein
MTTTPREKQLSVEPHPENVDPESCRRFLKTRNPDDLMWAFRWDSTPQGGIYWSQIHTGTRLLSNSDILLLEGWILEAVFTE